MNLYFSRTSGFSYFCQFIREKNVFNTDISIFNIQKVVIERKRGKGNDKKKKKKAKVIREDVGFMWFCSRRPVDHWIN